MQTGIYIHIPFCKKACIYCNFHFSTQLSYVQQMVDAICNELQFKANSLYEISTIYLGGGTPSILNANQLKQIFTCIDANYNTSKITEITIELNPENCTKVYLEKIKKITPINRLSIGIQSFNEKDLQFYNRVHGVDEAIQAIENAKIYYQNISIDLIYGAPTLDDKQWLKNLQIANDFGIKHLSCYSLTIEEKTALAKAIETNEILTLDDEKNAHQFELLQQFSIANSWHHYEISNLAKPGFEAIHNSNYWKQLNCLAIGPSAHQLIKGIRTKNCANNMLYMKLAIANDFENLIEFKEKLSVYDLYNEYVLTNSRTSWGINFETITHEFGKHFTQHLLVQAAPFIAQNEIIKTETDLYLTNKGKFIADYIAEKLFFTNN